MNQWLTDKKNLPIVIAVAALILIGAVAAVVFEMGLFGGHAATIAPAAAPTTLAGAPVPAGQPAPTAPMPGAQPTPFGGPATGPASHAEPGAPGSPFAPAIATRRGATGPNGTLAKMSPKAAIEASNLTPAQKAAMLKVEASIPPQMAAYSHMTPQQQLAAYEKMTPQQQASMRSKIVSALSTTGLLPPSLTSMMPSTTPRNPFAPKYSGAQLAMAAVPPPVRDYVPFAPIFRLPNLGGTRPIFVNGPNNSPPIMVQLGRVAGVINSNGIRAIYEIDGTDTIVTPGSLLPENGGRVQSIQSDGITVALPDSKQTVQVPISAGNPAANAGGMPGPGSPPAPDEGAGAQDINNPSD